jgi:hypothetical protein
VTPVRRAFLVMGRRAVGHSSMVTIGWSIAFFSADSTQQSLHLLKSLLIVIGLHVFINYSEVRACSVFAACLLKKKTIKQKYNKTKEINKK